MKRDLEKGKGPVYLEIKEEEGNQHPLER